MGTLQNQSQEMIIDSSGEAEAKRTKVCTSYEDEIVDRLSSLPSDILVKILSLLPLHSAIATSTLSKRWCGLWTQITNLDLDNSIQEYNPDFYKIVDELLQRFTSPFIRKFNLPLHNQELNEDKQSLLESWFDLICSRNIEVLKFTARTPFEPPPCVFRTPSLVVLELRPWGAGRRWPHPKDAYYLPNLKKLSVVLYHPDFSSLKSLVLSCSSLEELSFEVDMIVREDVVNLGPCSKLKRLDMAGRWCNSYINNVVRIDAPNLEYLSISNVYDNSLMLHFASDTIMFREARFSMKGKFPSCGIICKGLIKPLRTFPNLARLNLKIDPSTCYNDMMDFLEKCPVLEELTLDLKYTFERNSYSKWPDAVPTIACVLSKNLKRIKIEVWNFEHGLRIHLLHLMKFILLCFAQVLELHIVKSTCQAIFERGDFECYYFYHQLDSFAEIMSTSQVIRYRGRYCEYKSIKGKRVDDCIRTLQ